MAEEGETPTLKDVYETFTSGGDMDGRTFVKLLKDTKVIDKSYTATQADLLFTKVRKDGKRGQTKVIFSEFESAVSQIATTKKLSTDDLVDKICSSGGPVFNATKTDAVRFYDDKSTFTGVHAHGGPTTIDGGRTFISDLSQATNRQAATVRGTDKKIDAAAKK
eukprot:GHVN01019431.1.p2 GENE.GHVN01019431.1~~GHVN01019431.1.p2  ORF type:complete len:164 (+),score=20.84 GHVN01019431.1:1075-1566(+)